MIEGSVGREGNWKRGHEGIWWKFVGEKSQVVEEAGGKYGREGVREE